MLVSKTIKAAAGLCLMAATAMAQQMPQMAEVPAARMTAPAKLTAEQMKSRFEALKMQQVSSMKSMKEHKLQLSDKALKPVTTLPAMKPQVQTRATGFAAYYPKPAGVYNIKAGFQFIENGYTRHGILAPIYQEVVYHNQSTGAQFVDWIINGESDTNQDSLVAIYLPSMSSTQFYEPMPELNAYALTGDEDIYQYGYCLNPETGEYTEGQAVNVPWGMVHNLDAGAESFYNTYIATMGTDWTQMIFGYNADYKPAYVEMFEKPLSPVVINSVYTYVACPVNYDLSDVKFSLYVMDFDETTEQWNQRCEKVTAVPGTRLGQLTEECDVWNLNLVLTEPLLIDKQFALVMEGPQDGSAFWAFMHQDDRDLSSNYYTAGYIPSEGEYAGYLMPYALEYNGEVVPYPASIDLGLEMYQPYNMVMDTTTFEFLNYGGMIQANQYGIQNAPAYLWNWWAYVVGSKASITITSDCDWLRATVLEQPRNEFYLSTISITCDQLPAGISERTGTLTIADNMGYKSTWTFNQVFDAAGIEDVVIGEEVQTTLDPNAPIYDLTGREVKNPAGGIYIQNGRKFVVK